MTGGVQVTLRRRVACELKSDGPCFTETEGFEKEGKTAWSSMRNKEGICPMSMS
jgi:hypothetical protein